MSHQTRIPSSAKQLVLIVALFLVALLMHRCAPTLRPLPAAATDATAAGK